MIKSILSWMKQISSPGSRVRITNTGMPSSILYSPHSHVIGAVLRLDQILIAGSLLPIVFDDMFPLEIVRGGDDAAMRSPSVSEGRLLPHGLHASIHQQRPTSKASLHRKHCFLAGLLSCDDRHNVRWSNIYHK